MIELYKVFDLSFRDPAKTEIGVCFNFAFIFIQIYIIILIKTIFFVKISMVSDQERVHHMPSLMY